MIRIALIATAALALFVTPAGAKTFSAEQGAVKATVTYNKTTTTRLTIVRNGATLYDAAPNIESCGGAPCVPSGFEGDPPLRVLDLDGDSEPEVVYSAYSGGAHCCSIAEIFDLNAQGTAYTTAEHNFFDPGFQIRTTSSGPLFFTADDAFAYRFTAYAFSGLPIQILQYANGDFTDRTNDFPALIRKDAKRWRKVYNRARKRTDRTQQGAAAAWAADQYRLGKRASALRFLHAEVKRGHLRAKFVKGLDKFLKKHGY